MSVLSFQNVDKTYGSKIALSNVSFTIEPGRVVGLLGPNGSGKTTIIKLINGLLQPNSGQVLIYGRKPDASTKGIVSYLPDTTYFNDNMTVQSAVEMFTDFYKDFDANRAYQLMHDLHIDPKSKFSSLSKGNKEKVQLILVMSRRAYLYVLDEPIGGVDPAARDYILHTIVNNFDPQASVIISTHLVQDVEPILNEVLFINQGQVFRHSSVEEIHQQYQLSVDQLFRQEFRLY